MRICVVSHALSLPENRARWKRLAECHEASVTLLVPHFWQSRWFGNLTTWRPMPEQTGGYRVLPIQVSNTFEWWKYVFVSLDAHLREIRPDVIHVCQEENTNILQQMIVYRRLWVPRARLVLFSWNNRAVPQTTFKQRLVWRSVCASADAAIAGNQETREVLRRAGFRKPIIIQTEIGAGESVFYPDESIKLRMRAQLDLQGVVIGFAGQITEDKGVLDLAKAMCNLPGEWTLLMVGEGDKKAEIEARFAQFGLTERLRIAGQVPRDYMPDHLRAMDCLVLPSRTTPTCKEQFGLVLAEAMLCGVPVVGSDSGAIPEVIGGAGMVFREGDVAQLAGCLQTLLRNSTLRNHLAKKGYEKALSKYSATALADETYQFYQRLLDGSIQDLAAQRPSSC